MTTQENKKCCRECYRFRGEDLCANPSCNCHQTAMEKKKRTLEAINLGLTKEEAEKSWYVNDPTAPQTIRKILKGLKDALTPPTPIPVEGWEEGLRLRVNFDKNQDREVCVLFIRNLLLSQRQALVEKVTGMRKEKPVLIAENLEARLLVSCYNEALDDIIKIIKD